MYHIDPDTRMAMRIEGGPERISGPLEMAQEALARNDSGSKYLTLQDTFGARDDDRDPLEGWDVDNVEEMLRCTLGSAEDFAAEYEAMSDEERATLFPDPTVAELVGLWAKTGSSTDQ